MSKPKTGRVEIVDREAAERQRREREEQEGRELADLRNKKKRAASEERRLQALAAKERERVEREQRRAEERRRLAEQARAVEEQAYQRVRADLQQALERRSLLLGRFAGLTLPPEPDLAESDRADARSARIATEQLAQRARAYQQQVDAALLEWHKGAAAQASQSRAGALSAALPARAVRSAADVISALEPITAAAASQSRDAALQRRAARARELLASCGDGTPWRDSLELSDRTLSALDAAVSAASEEASQGAMADLRAGLADDAQQAQRAHAADLQRRADEQAREQAAAQRRDRELVATTVRETLQDLGYVVADEIEESAYASGGALHFSRSDWTNHAVALRVADDLTVRMEAVRVDAADAPAPSAADQVQREKLDNRFDAQWCHADGLGRFKEELHRRGLAMPLKQDFPVIPKMRVVNDAETGGVLAKARGHTAADVPLQERELPGPT